MSRIKLIIIMRQASQKPAIVRPGDSEVDESVAKNEKPTSTKQNAVSGDIYPIGTPPAVPLMGIPRCSAFKCIP